MSFKNNFGTLGILLSVLAFSACAPGTDNGATSDDMALFAGLASTLPALDTGVSDSNLTTGCTITASNPTPKPGESVTFTMTGAGANDVENAGIITGRYASVGDLPATMTIIAPDSDTKYTLSVFTVNGVRTYNNNCDVTLNIAPKGTADIPLPTCELKSSLDIVPYSGKFTLSWTSTGALSAELYPANAIGVISAADLASGSHELSSWYGDNYSMRVWNANGESSMCAVNIKPDVSVNSPPAANDGVLTLNAGDAVQGNMSATDIENDPLTFSIKTAPTKGTVSITNAATGEFTYTANASTSGGDSFTFTTNDGNLDSNIGTIHIKINTNKLMVTQISAGDSHTCALFNDGTIRCWGHGEYGQLGNGQVVDSSVPVPVSNITNAIQVSTGSYHSCATLSDGTISCWGWGTHGQLGTGSTNDSSLPLTVANITNAIQVSAGSAHTCATLNDGTARCWGFGWEGQLGNGARSNSTLPVQVSNLTDAVQLSTGDRHSCAMLNNGTARCWGNGWAGKLGNGSLDNSSVPVPVSNISNGIQMTSGAEHTCVTLSDKTARCWGWGVFGQLGDGFQTHSSLPTSVLHITDALEIVPGGRHTCVLLGDGTGRCFGKGGEGQLGSGRFANSTAPLPVTNLTDAVQITTGSLHSCALLNDGTVRCWGWGLKGQLGNNSNSNSPSPVDVLNLK